MASNRTRNQDRILQTLQALNHEIAAQDLYIYLQENGQRIGLATVYRSLDVLKQQGEIQVRTLDSGMSLYSSLQRDRHHLNCVKCGHSQALDECPLHDLEHQLQATTKFKVFYHTLEFYGLCDTCQKEEVNGDSSLALDAPSNTSTPPQSSSRHCC